MRKMVDREKAREFQSSTLHLTEEEVKVQKKNWK